MLERIAYPFGRGVAQLFMRLRLDVDLTYHSSLPTGPKIFVANHPTTLDPYLVLSLIPDQISMLLTDRVFRVPVLGRIFQMSGHIKVSSKAGAGWSAIREAKCALERGRAIGMFPEGELSPLEGGHLAPYRGAARLAACTNTPVVPIGIAIRPENLRIVPVDVKGQHEVVRWYPGGPYIVTIGEPLHFDGEVDSHARAIAATEQIMARIDELTQESKKRLIARLTTSEFGTVKR